MPGVLLQHPRMSQQDLPGLFQDGAPAGLSHHGLHMCKSLFLFHIKFADIFSDLELSP